MKSREEPSYPSLERIPKLASQSQSHRGPTSLFSIPPSTHSPQTDRESDAFAFAFVIRSRP